MNMIILFLISSFQTMAAESDVVPLFLIDYDDVMDDIKYEANPFSKMSSIDFGDIVHELVKRSDGVVIFIEETLCSEDVSTRDKLGTPFFNLRKGLLDRKVKYFPKVVDPYVTLSQIVHPQQKDVFYLNVGTKLLFRKNFKHIYVYFQEIANVTRAQALRRHDLIVKEVLTVVKQMVRKNPQVKSGPLVAFYTGKFNPVVVEKLSFIPIEPLEEPTERSVFVSSDGALFRFRDVHTMTLSRRSAYRQTPMITDESWEESSLRTTMAYTEFELQFNFQFKPDKWMLDSVALIEGGEEVGRTEMDVAILWDWSYVCAEPLVIVNTRDGSSVAISQYQIQPRKGILRNNDTTSTTESATTGAGANDTGNNTFGKAVNCGPYFSSVILSALLVTFVCLGILAHGIVTLCDCSSNDRFDDPNGKPLSAAEAHG